jgi:hypothetical protein
MKMLRAETRLRRRLRARAAGAWLASARRVLLTLLAILGGVVALLARSGHLAVGRPAVIVLVVWLGLWLPSIRVLALEWYARRRIEELGGATIPHLRVLPRP